MDIILLKINETYKVMKISLPVTERTKNVPYHLEYNWNLEKSTLLKLENWKLQKFIDSERRKEKINGIVEQLNQLNEEEKFSEDKNDYDEEKGNESLKLNSNATSSCKLPTEFKVVAKDASPKNTFPLNTCVKGNKVLQCSNDLRFNDTNLNQNHKATRIQENQNPPFELIQPAVKVKGTSNKVQTQTQLSSNSFSETSNTIKKYPSGENHMPSNSTEKSNRVKIAESIKFDSNLKDQLYSYRNKSNIAEVDFSEFDTVVSDPFENLQLDIINEAEELSNVLEPRMRHSVARPKTLSLL